MAQAAVKSIHGLHVHLLNEWLRWSYLIGNIAERLLHGKVKRGLAVTVLSMQNDSRSFSGARLLKTCEVTGGLRRIHVRRFGRDICEALRP